MRKILAILVTVILLLTTLTACGNKYKANEWISDDILSDRLVPNLPKVEKDYISNGSEVYVNYNDDEFNDYAQKILDYLISFEFKYLGTRGEQKNTLAGAFTTYYFKSAEKLSDFYDNGDYRFVYCNDEVDENGNPDFRIIIIMSSKWEIEHNGKTTTYNTGLFVKHGSETELNGVYVLPDEKHEHTSEMRFNEYAHWYVYTCGCETPDNSAKHSDIDGDLLCDDCKYEMSK